MTLSLLWPVVTLFLVLFATVSQPGDAIRLEYLADPEEGQDGAQEEAFDASCTMRTVTDGTACGITNVVSQITDSIKCGVKLCTKWGQQFPCGIKTCNEEKETNNTCEVIDKCPLKVRIFLEGHAYVGEFENASFDVQYNDIQVTEGVPEVRDFLNSNTQVLKTVANMLVDQAVQMGQQEVEKLKTDVTETLAGYAGGEDVAKYFNTLGDDPHQALEDTVRECLPKLGASFAPFYHESLEQHALAASAGKRTRSHCGRWLRVKVRGQKAFYIENWEHVEVAKTFDLASECESTFYAQCSRGTLQEVRRCPGDVAPQESERCLPGPGCRSFRRKIHGWIVSIRLPGHEDEELIGGGNVFLRSKKPKENREKQRFLGETEETVRAREEYRDDSMQAVVSVPLFQSIFQDNMCRAAKRMKSSRCKAATSTLFRWFQLSIKAPMPESELLPEKLPVKLRFKKGNFEASTVPPWSELEQYIEQMLMDVVNAQELPLNMQITEANVDLKPGGQFVKITDGSWVDIRGEVDAAMLAGQLGSLASDQASQLLGSLPLR